jgi:ribonuclease VapC
VLDSSAIIAITRHEPDGPTLQATLTTSADDVVLPSSQYLEIVMVPRNAGLSRLWLDGFLSRFDIRIAAFTESTARLAADAFERYGKGTGHPARLNFGDCFAYAVAMKKKNASLLFKGDDFALTDVSRAL